MKKITWMFGLLCLLASPLFASPIIQPGNYYAVYNGATGDIKLTLPAGLSTWKVGNHSGTAANLIVANMVNWTTPGSLRTKQTIKMGETTTGALNAVTLFDLGNVAKPGLPFQALDLTVGWLGGSATVPVGGGPWPPVVEGGGPYEVGPGESVTLDGEYWWDGEPGPGLSSFSWDLPLGNHASGPTPTLGYDYLVNTLGITPGTYNITLCGTFDLGGPTPYMVTDTAQLTIIAPEPATMSLLALGGLGLLRRRT